MHVINNFYLVERVFGGNLERNTKRDKREKEVLSPDGAKRGARVLIPPGYLHPGKRKH
jgi:hypothetical protein